jgi:pyruvate/2-oxoglutarate dehydrogenase complex dihydrolipoamide acyltransferase (E2) component
MGEVIRKSASAEDIVADVRTTLTNARAKGGVFMTLAEERLAGLMTIIDDIEVRLSEASKVQAPLLAVVEAKNDEADGLLGRISDEIWNAVGRPASDPTLSILFPGGIAYYAAGSTQGQPDRMDLLAELLDSGLHPRLDPAAAKAHAKEVRDSAIALRAAVEAAAAPTARVELLDRVRRALAAGAQVELANLKRIYKAERFSEADIHTVIPDRPSTAKKTPVPPAPSPAPSAPQAA